MADVVSKGTLFPTELTNEMFDMVRGKSSLARLSDDRPIPFVGQTEFTFTLDKEADIVAENGAKTKGGATVTPVTIIPIKFEYGARVSDEFVYASEEKRIEYLRTFAEGFAKKIARALDISAIYGINPRTKQESALIGNNCFLKKVPTTNQVNASTTSDAMIDEAIAKIEGVDHEVTGVAMAPTLRSTLAGLRTDGGERLYPDLAWGRTPETVNGVQFEVNSTVSFNKSIYGLLGNFRDYFKWGYAKNIPLEVIEYGNPDNDEELGDLKGHNQVYLRSEVYLGWAILDGTAFAEIINPEGGENQ